MNKGIVIVAEESAVRATVARILHLAGYRVELASRGEQTRNLIRRGKASAVILVYSACTKARLQLGCELGALVSKLVILVRSANDLSTVRRWVPEADVLSYPPDEIRLLAALSEHMHVRSEGAELHASMVRFSNWTLDPAGRVLHNDNGRQVSLTRGEYTALSAFLQHSGRVLSRKYLRRLVSGRTLEPDDRSVDVLIGRLRRKIEERPTSPQLVMTVPGGGYKLAVRVEGPSSPEPIAGSSDPPHVPERRQVTIVTCQAVGLADLASAVDPEDLQIILRTVQCGFAEIVARFQGRVVQSLGDSMLAFFGYPRAHEEDAENAVRAGLELIRQFPQFETCSTKQLAARIGIATGLVVVGDFGLSGAHEPSAVGEAVILARHLLAVAPTGGILMADNTRDLVGSTFESRQFDSMAAKTHGCAPIWEVLAEGPLVGRFAALRSSHLCDFVGRSEELERLLGHWSKAKSGIGQAVVLTGEAGIGKSRLLLELERRLGVAPRAKLKFSGLPHQVDTPMSALLDEVRSSAAIAAKDSPSQRLKKLQQLIGAQGTKADDVPLLLAAFLDPSSVVDSRLSQLSPQRCKKLTLAALLRRVERLAAHHPLLIIWEDAQWIDPTSLEFLTLLVECAAVWPVLILVVGRQDFIPPWSDHSHVAALTMSRLTRDDSMALIEQLSDGRPLPADLKHQILSRTDGVPLFIEELTKSVRKSKPTVELGDADNFGLCSPATPAPGRLQAFLLERIDRLGDAKEIAQEGAAVGREFSYEILRLISDKSEMELSAALEHLVVSGLVFGHGQHPQANYIFKHALVGEAAHSMLHRSRRQKLHARISEVLESHFPEIVRLQPALLAHHCVEAGLVMRAVDYLRAAVRQALSRSGTSEALAHIDEARRLILLLPETQQRSQLELEFEITLSRVLTAVQGYTAPASREAYDRARLHCEASSNQAWLPLVILGQWLRAWGGSDHRLALKYAEELRSCGDRDRISAVQAVAHMAIGMTLMLIGELTRARQHLEQSLSVNQFALPSQQPFLFPDANGRISSLTYLHDCLLLLGHAEQAEPLVKMAEDVTLETEARAPNQHYSQALARNHTLRMHVFRRDVPKVQALGSALLGFAREQEYPYFLGTSQIYTGWAMARNGEVKTGVERCREGLSRLRDIGAKCWFPHHSALISECYAMAGDIERGCQVIAETLANTAETGEAVWDAELHRLKGQLLVLAGANKAEIESCFVSAMTKARQQGARLFELRAATDFARFRGTRSPLMRNCYRWSR